MRVGIPKQTQPAKTRIGAAPETTIKMKAKRFSLIVERGAGEAAHFSDQAYHDTGAVSADRDKAFGSDIVLKVIQPTETEVTCLTRVRSW